MAAPRALLAVFALVLLFGCISMDYVQKVEPSGDSELTVNIDISSFISMAESMAEGMGNASEGGDTGAQLQESCDEAEQQDSTITCTYADGILTLSKPLSLDEGFYGFESEKGLTSTRYTFTLRKLPDAAEGLDESVGEDSGMDGSPLSGLDLEFTDPRAQEQAPQMRSIFAITYTVEMPGTVVSAEGAASMKDNRAVFDVLEMMENGQNIVVVSEESDNTLVYVAGAVVVVLALAALFYLRGRGPAGGKTGPGRADPRLAGYVKENLSAGHSPEQIKGALLDAGWTEQDVDEALREAS